ncbi:MAG TPA: hypothetical protein VFX61_17210 [Micromonosporaceae bacterium]|nr:hypothetical protein [Micromonosporaceae bacterium]
MAVDVYTMLVQFVQNILTDRDAAVQYVQDPHGTLAAQGITDNDLSGCNVQQVVGEAIGSPDVPHETRTALQPYSGGGPTPPHHPVQPPPQSHHAPVENVVQHLNYVTYVTYEGDDYITQQLINIDNSQHIDNSVNVDIDVDGNLHGGIDIDTTNVNALGDGSVANAGDGDVNAATGAGAQIIDGDNHGQANTGDGAVQVGGNNQGAVNTGTNSGIIAGDDVEQAVVGDNNQTVQIDGSTDGTAINFGAGNVTNVNDTHVENGSVAVGGDATNVSGNTLGDGSAIAAGGDASGHNQDTTTTTTITDIDTTTNTIIDQDYTYENIDNTYAPSAPGTRTLNEPDSEAAAGM